MNTETARYIRKSEYFLVKKTLEFSKVSEDVAT